jgi:hypothetical protein
VPDTLYDVVHCWNSVPSAAQVCEPPSSGLTLTSSPTGTLSTSLPAVQRLNVPNGSYASRFYCRDACQVGLINTVTHHIEGAAGYAMAEGSIEAAPATGLEDGQTVTVSGHELMPTYAGRTFWIFSTGTWAPSDSAPRRWPTTRPSPGSSPTATCLRRAER